MARSGTGMGRGEDAPAFTVLQLVPRLDEGGVERGTVEIAAAIVAAGGRALVASRGGRLEPALRRAGGVLVRLPMDAKTPWGIVANIGRLRRVIREYRVDIVHARSRAPAWSGLAAARAEGAAFVTTWHGTYSEGFPGKRWYNSVMARGRPVIAISDFIAALVRDRHGVPASRIVTIPRGADLTQFDPSRVTPDRLLALTRDWGLDDDPRPVVLLPARLTRWKGQMVAVEAAGLLRPQDGALPFLLVLAGGNVESAYATELATRADRLGLGDALRMVGPVPDMPAALKLSALVLCPSTDPEAFGRTAVEAQAMGRRVIASDHGGARETVAPGETGWLVRPGDPRALADAIGAALAQDREAVARMEAAGRSRVAGRYTVAAMQDATVAVYRQVMTGRVARPTGFEPVLPP